MLPLIYVTRTTHAIQRSRVLSPKNDDVVRNLRITPIFNDHWNADVEIWCTSSDFMNNQISSLVPEKYQCICPPGNYSPKSMIRNHFVQIMNISIQLLDGFHLKVHTDDVHILQKYILHANNSRSSLWNSSRLVPSKPFILLPYF